MSDTNNQTRILWIAPNLNHYKIQFLSRLAENPQLELVVMAGRTPVSEGHRDELGADREKLPFEIMTQAANKRQFAFHPSVFFNCTKTLWNGKFDTVLMPAEKKHLPLLIWLVLLRLFFSFKLLSYNHPVLRSQKHSVTKADRVWTRVIFALYDRIVFYTETARDWAVNEKLLSSKKSTYANNTLNTDLIWQSFEFDPEPVQPPRILFIARLIPSKRLDLVLEYFSLIKQQVPELCLTIIGDGPDADLAQKAAESDPAIKWCGALVNEPAIADEMRSAQVVFIPGESGLSIVHAFAYGKPYITLDLPNQTHGPEISYLKNGENGLLLDGDMQGNSNKIANLLTDSDYYSRMSNKAFNSAQKLSIDNWSAQMLKALSY